MLGLIRRFLRRFAEPGDRYVLLINFRSEMKIVKAEKSQVGWIANWWEYNPDTWVILLPKGEVTGYRGVKAWAPHSGWDGSEFLPQDQSDNVVSFKRQSQRGERL